MISETVGMQEMGLMAGVGIIFTMLATIIILPTMLVIRERLLKNFNKSLPPKDVSYPFLGRIAEFTAKYRWIMGIFFLLITGFLFNRGVNCQLIIII
jgi:predicted RND superfamily exporter protein